MSAEKRTLLVLFAIALGLRVLYGAFLATQPDLTPGATSELSYAKQIVSGTRWITEPYSPRSPGYPVVLAALYVLSARELWLVTFLQAAVGALTVLLVYRLGRPLLGQTLAVAAALWFALHARHMHLSYAFERDVLAVFLLMLVLHLLVRPFVRTRYALVAGVSYTVLVHVDPQFLLLLPVLAVFVLFKTRHGYINIQYLFLFLGVIIVASIPWTVRNYIVYRQPLPIGLEAARFLRPVKLAVTEPRTEIADIEGRIVRASRSRFIKDNAIEFWRFAKFRGQKPALTGQTGAAGTTKAPPGAEAWSVRHNLASILNYGVVLPFFLMGIVYAVRSRSRPALMLIAVVITYFLMRTYLGGSEQARLPVDPVIVVVGFYGAVGLVRRFRPEETLEAGDQSGA